jgi:hypothetical protein
MVPASRQAADHDDRRAGGRSWRAAPISFLCPIADNASANFAWLFDTHNDGRICGQLLVDRHPAGELHQAAKRG